jgi:hypothetical protein
MANRRLEEYEADLVRNVNTDLVRAIVEDNRSRPSSGGSMIPNKVTVVGAGKVSTPDYGPKYRAYQPAPENRSGWREAPKVDDWKPPGLEIMDRLVDHQDLIDRAARIKELAEAAKHLKAMAEAEDELKAQEKGSPK